MGLRDCDVDPGTDTLVFDASRLRVSAPSAVDELVRSCLVDVGVARVRVDGAPARTQQHFLRCAANHGVEDRLTVLDLPADVAS